MYSKRSWVCYDFSAKSFIHADKITAFKGSQLYDKNELIRKWGK